MNIAKQLLENDAAAPMNLQLDEAVEPSNIIPLPEQSFSWQPLETHAVTEGFADHEFSALNEW